MRRRAGAAIAALALGLTSVAAGAAAQASTDGQASPQSPWHRYHQQDFVVPAGQGCAFRVAGHVLFDREFYRVISRFEGGQPRVELFRGPLMVQYVNVHVGTKVIRNISGVGTEKFNRDGSFASIKAVSGHFGATLPPGSPAPGQGVYYLGGQGTSVTENPDGTATLRLGPHGTAQNLCPLLHG
jgi:hypothetical protein